MRATHVKRLAILIAVLVLIIGSSVLAQRFQIKRLAQSVAKQADSAAKAGDFEKAEKLYREHLAVVSDDMDVQIKYADMLLKVAPSPRRQLEALQIYADFLKRNMGNENVRRKQMKLKFDMGLLTDLGAEEDLNILLNLAANKTDGNLLFLMGRCCEEGGNYEAARTRYEEAIKYDAPQKIEAYQRLATLLRDPARLNDPKDADQVIEEMVQSSPRNYLVYLGRGRYRRQFNLPDSKADFEKATKLAGEEPETFLEMARTVDKESGYDEARKILDAGLKKIPTSDVLYTSLADLELRTGHVDQAVEVLERGLKSAEKKSELHGLLAHVLALRGDTSRLLLQIEELKNIGSSALVVQYLTAHYYVNSHDFQKARQLLVPLESYAGLRPDIKARVNTMLAQCYSQLGEPAMQQEAYLRALTINPDDVTAKRGLIDRMIKEGDIEGAIKEYRTLVKRAPHVSLPLAKLLILWNQQRPLPQRDWSEVKGLIDGAEKSLPESVEPFILRADLYVAQDQYAEAHNELEKARSRFPKNVAIRCAQAKVMGIQKQFDKAENLLDQAQKELGDSVELRFQRARLSLAEGGPQVLTDLNDLSQNVESFSKEDRRRLLTGLASEFLRLQDLQRASRLLTRLAEQEPNDLELRLEFTRSGVSRSRQRRDRQEYQTGRANRGK